MRRCGLLMARRLQTRDWGTLLRATVGYDLTQRVELKAESLISKRAFRRATVRRGLVILGFDSRRLFTPVIWFWTDS